MRDARRFVYIIQSIGRPVAYYVGLTSDVEARLAAHNAGLSPHTAVNRPWRRLVVVEFDEEKPAVEFEKYLKTGSGREFARHFRRGSPASLREPLRLTHKPINSSARTVRRNGSSASNGVSQNLSNRMCCDWLRAWTPADSSPNSIDEWCQVRRLADVSNPSRRQPLLRRRR